MTRGGHGSIGPTLLVDTWGPKLGVRNWGADTGGPTLGGHYWATHSVAAHGVSPCRVVSVTLATRLLPPLPDNATPFSVDVAEVQPTAHFHFAE